MADLVSLDVQTTLRETGKLLGCLRLLQTHIAQCSSLPHQDIFREITEYTIGELEKCAAAAPLTRVLELASATRNLFELSFVVDYISASDERLDRFIVDAAIDELEIMKKFLPIDERDANYQPDKKSQERMKTLQEQICKAGLTGERPLMPNEMAQEVERQNEYKEWNRVYSKMSHATAWAIHGKCHWDKMVVLLLRNATSYGAKCLMQIARKTGLQPDPTVPSG
jgi:hypothetical protein